MLCRHSLLIMSSTHRSRRASARFDCSRSGNTHLASPLTRSGSLLARPHRRNLWSNSGFETNLRLDCKPQYTSLIASGEVHPVRLMKEHSSSIRIFA